MCDSLQLYFHLFLCYLCGFICMIHGKSRDIHFFVYFTMLIPYVEWVDKALQQSLKKEKIKSRFTILWNLTIESCNHGWKVWSKWLVFTIIKKEHHENSYQIDATNKFNKSGHEAKATTKFLNILETFQQMPTTTTITSKFPFSPTTCYYVEMPCNPNTLTNNHEEDVLVVNSKNPTFELDDLTGPN